MRVFFFFFCNDPLFRNNKKMPENITPNVFHLLTQGILQSKSFSGHRPGLVDAHFFSLSIINLPLSSPNSSSSLFFSVLQLTNLTEIHDQISGMARCPYNPLHNSTALITSSGELYAATAMDFSGRDPAIYRSLGGLPPLRTAQYNSKWLNGRKVWARHGICKCM